jgi:ATP-binding cassette subfamily B protein
MNRLPDLARHRCKDSAIATPVAFRDPVVTGREHTASATAEPPSGPSPRPPEVVRVPEAVRARLGEAGLDRQPVLLGIDTDALLDGTPGREWLVVSATDLAVTDGEAHPRSIPWSEMEKVRTTAGLGGGTLQVKTDGVWVDLLRYTNARAARFHKVARGLDRLRESPDLAAGRADHIPGCDGPLDPPRCPSCDLRLAHVDDACPRCLQKGQILRRVGELLAPYARGSILLALLTLVGVVAELVPPKLQQYMVDDILSARGEATAADLPDFQTALLVVVLSLALSRVLLSVVGVLKGRLTTTIGTGITATLREEMVRKLQSLSVAYYDRHQVGSMVSRVAHDSEVLHGLVHQFTGGFLLQIVQLLAVGGMLFWINPKLALYTLIPVPLVVLGSWIFWKHVYPRHYRLWDASSKQMTRLSGMLSGIRVVKAFAQEDREHDRFHTASDNLRAWRAWVERSNATYSAAMQIVFSLGGLIVWYVGGRDVIGSQMSLGQLIAFLAYLAMFYAPLGTLSHFTTWLTSFLSGSKRVLELLDTPALITDPTAPEPWNDPRGEIRFENVTFGYDRNQPVLHDVSFTVQPGEMVGIVGRSGSGKTTLVSLLGRFHDVDEGRILVDGIDIRHLAVRDLRERLGIVFQDSYLFRNTIWKNLAYGRPAATIEEGLSAAKAAGAHDFICRQPLAYETMLGERGAGLSGGEKQRLSIARTLLYDPRILVLDEATSNIDAEAEKAIQEALAVLVRGRTTIAIAHRLSTLRNADRILAFDRGRLFEEGSHAELLATDGLYARLVRIQTQVSKQPTVDRLLMAEPPVAVDPPPEPATVHHADIVWLDPATHRFVIGPHERIELQAVAGGGAAGVFVLATFPASHPDEFLSVRAWRDDGEEIELGMIRRLADWSETDGAVVREALLRRSLVRRIERVHDVRLVHGYLDFDVETDVGRRTFTARWTQSQVSDFGSDGKMLVDTEENRWVVPRVDALPPADRERFLHYVYW